MPRASGAPLMSGGGVLKLQSAEASIPSVVDLGKAYSIVGVMKVRKYLLNEKGSCNGCDQSRIANAA